MKRVLPIAAAGVIAGAGLVGLLERPSTDATAHGWNLTSPALAGKPSKAARAEHFQRMLADPATGEIPVDVRARELAGYRAATPFQPKGADAWREAGPDNVSGRVRAFAYDVRNPDRVLTGGVMGGLWASNDGGQNWYQTNTPDDSVSVTALAQDPRPGFEDRWYFAGGELQGSKAGGQGGGPFGSGILVSDDGGESWEVLDSTSRDPELSIFSTLSVRPYGGVVRLAVSPVDGALYAATYKGIFRSVDGGDSFQQVISVGQGYTDIAIHPSGRLLAANSQLNGRIFVSETGAPGDWTALEGAEAFPATSRRTVVAIAPSDPSVGYALTLISSGQFPFLDNPGVRDDVRAYRLDLDAGTFTELTPNLPQASDANIGRADLLTQGGYNMTLAVKPDDPDFVVFGGTSLFRSLDGFASPVTDAGWIGGYDTFGTTGDHHPDQHAFVFHPERTNEGWSANDSGIYYANDLFLPTESTVFWDDRGIGLNITQLYHFSMSALGGEPTIIAGTQDNGSPLMRFAAGQQAAASEIADVSSGDGSFSYVPAGDVLPCLYGFPGCDIPLYTSVQQGIVIAVRSNETFAILQPREVDTFFINPYTIDPNNERLMYYPALSQFWRNQDLSQIPDTDFSDPDAILGTNVGWERIPAFDAGENGAITAFGVSVDVPHRLYYATTEANNDPARVFRVDDAHVATGGRQELTAVNLPPNVWVNDIAVNPRNADELMVVVSNYNTESLHYSNDGGASFSTVEGNLGDVRFGPLGPSVRSATFFNRDDGTVEFLVATSTGVHATDTLAGGNTVWNPVGVDTIGNARAAWIRAREADGRVVVGTHGRGVFVRDVPGGAPSVPENPPLGLLFDPARDGHGMQVARVGDTYVFLFYTYDAEGAPEWYLGTGRYEGGVLISDDLARYTYDVTRSPPQQVEPGSESRMLLSYQPNDVAEACPDAPDDGKTRARFLWEIGGESASWCFESLVRSPGIAGDFGGTWFSPGDEGWGLSLANAASTLVGVIYYYDADGRGRWAIGVGEGADGFASIELPMLHVNGYCRTCPFARTDQAAGPMTLSLLTPSRDAAAGNTVATELVYPVPPGGDWQKGPQPLILLTDPPTEGR